MANRQDGLVHRVLVAEKIADPGLDALRAAGHEVDVRIGLSPEELRDAIAGVSGLIVRSATQVDAELIAAAGPSLAVVGRAGVGLDNVDTAAATANGVRLAVSMTKTSETGRATLDRVGTSSVWFGEAVDGDRLPLSLPLGKQLLEKSVVFGIRDAQAAAFFPEQELFGTGEEGVSQVELKGASVGVSV